MNPCFADIVRDRETQRVDSMSESKVPATNLREQTGNDPLLVAIDFKRFFRYRTLIEEFFNCRGISDLINYENKDWNTRRLRPREQRSV